MVGKIAAMADARASDETLIIARTDAVAVEGFDAAIDRAEAYVEAGATCCFVEALRSIEEMRAVTERFAGRVPLLANMVEGGATPITGAADLEALGYSIVIFPGGIVRALAKTARTTTPACMANGSNRPFADRMFDFDGLNAQLGTPEMLARGKAYDDPDKD
jgi:2-methylisocitrate lyase-like PEP mutase family enzyme